MAFEVVIPRLGWSMEEGTFSGWLKKEGDFVRSGEALFSLEGEKAIQDIESLDEGILRTHWMSYDELKDCQEKHRSPLVMQCVDDYLMGKRAPLSMIFTHPSAIGVMGG